MSEETNTTEQPPATETVTYSDGTSATGPAPLPEQSPEQQGANAHGIGPDTDGGPNPDYVPPRELSPEQPAGAIADTMPPDGMRFTQSSTAALEPATAIAGAHVELAEGGKVLFTHSDGLTVTVETICKVWGPGCVNLSDHKWCSVLVFQIGEPIGAKGYYCVPFVDEPALRDPDVPEEVLALSPADEQMVIFHRLERAQALPEVDADEVVLPIQPAQGLIHHFKSTDGRNMRIVLRTEDRGFAAQALPARA